MSGLTLSTVCSARPAGVWFLGLGKSSLHRVPSSGSADSVFVRGMVSEDSRAISQAPTTAGRLKLLPRQSPYSRKQSLGEPHKLAAYGQRKELEPEGRIIARNKSNQLPDPLSHSAEQRNYLNQACAHRLLNRGWRALTRTAAKVRAFSWQKRRAGESALLSCTPFHHRDQSIRLSSTRRFCARPSSVSFDATGSDSPCPTAVSCAAATPCCTR